MYNNWNSSYQCPYCGNSFMYNPCNMYQCPFATMFSNNPDLWSQLYNYYIPDEKGHKTGSPIALKDYGPKPFAVDIEEAAKQNNNYRIALWTGKYLQVTLMSINVGEDIGLEVHPNLDQFIRIEEGQGLLQMGDSKDRLDFQRRVEADYAFVIPAGTWHNLINTGNRPIKLYSIYAPPQHPFGTVHRTKRDANE